MMIWRSQRWVSNLLSSVHSRWLSTSFNQALLLWDNRHHVNRCKLPPHAVAACSGEQRQLLSNTNTNCNLLDGKINQCTEWIMEIGHWEVIGDIIVSSAVSMEIKLESIWVRSQWQKNTLHVQRTEKLSYFDLEMGKETKKENVARSVL